jgi:hypothetical protein
MTFAFTAIGTKAEVGIQLAEARKNITVGPDRFNAFGVELLDLVAKHFREETAQAGLGYEYRYVVKASGHGGGNSPLYVDLHIEALWVAAPPAEEPQPEPPIISGG